MRNLSIYCMDMVLNSDRVILPSFYFDEIFDKNKRFAIGYTVLAK